jgi:ion channel-forming bestrophin family protein
VGLGLSFRSSTAYERYAEGRKYWAQLIFTTHNLARTIWIFAKEREGEEGKRDLLLKVQAMNLFPAFAIALKHKLRFEPGIYYDDLKPYVEYLETFARAADDHIERPPKKPAVKVVGEYLGVSFAESNPRKYIKRAKQPVGNLPLEILKHLSAYANEIISNGTLGVSIYQTHMINGITTMNEILIGTERVLNTPLPIAYSIAISQITWVYVIMLPFQLWNALRWITIPGTICKSSLHAEMTFD